VEICVSVTKATIIQIIIGIIVSAVVSFFCAKVLKWIVTSAKLKYFGIYDIGVGVITFVIGIFELILKK
jgi:undecaprenyl pyrophosphate phosphatase UppP